MSTPSGVVGLPGRGSCAACGASSPAGSLLCKSHWRQLPRTLRDDVWLAYRRFSNGDIDLTALRFAQAQAVNFIREGI